MRVVPRVVQPVSRVCDFRSGANGFLLQVFRGAGQLAMLARIVISRHFRINLKGILQWIPSLHDEMGLLGRFLLLSDLPLQVSFW